MSIGVVLLIVAGLILLGALPIWNHSSDWSYIPTGGASVILVVVLVLVLTGRI